MSTNSNIEWTDATWNPVTGCTRASTGCDNCYAVSMTKRLEAMGQTEKYGGLVKPGRKHFNGVVKCHEQDLGIPLRRKKPTTYFVNSMSDLFHEAVPFEFIDKVFAVMALAPQHTFQVLTKRAARMAEYFGQKRDWSAAANQVYDAHIRPLEQDLYLASEVAGLLPNVWLGVSVENQQTADERIPYLLQVPAAVHFLSCEPLLGPVDLGKYYFADKETGRYPFPYLAEEYRTKWVNLLNWVIVGGESGCGARPMHPAWARSLRDQCEAAAVPFLFKQWGAWGTIFTSMATKAPMMVQFDAFRDWVNEAGTWMKGATCLDTGGNVLNIGGDFMAARDAGRFPVALLHRIGKAKSGRLLDGTLHDAMPPRP